MKMKIICFTSMIFALMFSDVYASSSKITENIANVHISDTSVQIVDQLKKGTAINVLGSNGRLLKINYGNDLEGWIDVSCVRDKFPVTTALNWIEIPGAQELGISQDTQLGGNTGVGTTTDIGDYEKLEALVALAHSKVGSGRSEPGWNDEWEQNHFTCNGFITWLYLHIYDDEKGMAINLPANGIYQASKCEKIFWASDVKNMVEAGFDMDEFLKPGDVIYWHGVNWAKAGHVELYIGNGQTIGATGNRPESVTINDARKELLKGSLICVCRIIEDGKVLLRYPKSELRPLRKIPEELGIKLYDYEKLEEQGVHIIESNEPDNVWLKK